MDWAPIAYGIVAVILTPFCIHLVNLINHMWDGE